jgi:DNA gyrase subunit A
MPLEDRELIPTHIVDEMKDAYMDYAMSVIVSRALPDARDGLKPVHRRILYTMREENITPDRPFKKSASAVGNVIARYHPHGDQSVYDALVRMAQQFNMRYPLVQGHGNFGSVDGDNAAAMRYTEARLSRIAMWLLEDLDKNTVDWRPNFDTSLQEPVVFPTRIPNLLLNGSDGIAVGMATKIPPHNLSELIDGCFKVMDDPEVSIEDLMSVVPGPDFPTAAQILGQAGIREAYNTGRGSIIMRARMDVEDMKRDRKMLVATEIPFQVNKSRLLINIVEAIKEKRIEGISDLRDESDRKGMRIVFELSQGAQPELVMRQLFKYSELQTTFGVNMLALVNGVPKTLNLRDMLQVFIDHRRVVVRRRSQYLLDKALKRAHIVEGLLKALDHIDEIISLIRASADPNEARAGLINRFEFSEAQAQAILDMRLQRLTGLERDKLQNEYAELMAEIEYLRSILEDPIKLDGVVREELKEVKDLFGDDRRTEIVPNLAGELNIEDLIAEEKMVVTISNSGYIKRVPFDTYRQQRRGGRGISGTGLKEEDSLEHLFVSSTHHHILFFTNLARVFRMKVHQIQEFSRTAKGTPVINLLPMQEGEKIAGVVPIRSFEDVKGAIFTCTREGIVKRTDVQEYARINAAGKIALTLREGDELVSVKFAEEGSRLLLVTRQARSISFLQDDVRATGRTTQGVKGIDLRESDYVVAMDVVPAGFADEVPAADGDAAAAVDGDVGESPVAETEDGEAADSDAAEDGGEPDASPDALRYPQVLIVSTRGYGKRTSLREYPVQTRGGKGVKTMQLTEKLGEIVGAMIVNPETDEFMVSTLGGTLIRLAVKDVRKTARSTQGVRVIRLIGNDQVGAVTRVIAEPGEEEAAEDEDGEEIADILEAAAEDVGSAIDTEAAGGETDEPDPGVGG